MPSVFQVSPGEALWRCAALWEVSRRNALAQAQAVPELEYVPCEPYRTTPTVVKGGFRCSFSSRRTAVTSTTMSPRTAAGEKLKNWPLQIAYLRSLAYSSALTPSHLSSLRTRPTDAIDVPPEAGRGPCQVAKIAEIKDHSHPAFGQSGLFATKDLKPGQFILAYIGVVHAPAGPSQAEGEHAHSDYDLSLDREAGIAIDAAKMGNEARFINDYRGIKDKPNAEFKEIWDAKAKERGMAVWVLPLGKSGKRKVIRKGEEILVSYGRGFWGARRDNASPDQELAVSDGG